MSSRYPKKYCEKAVRKGYEEMLATDPDSKFTKKKKKNEDPDEKKVKDTKKKEQQSF